MLLSALLKRTQKGIQLEAEFQDFTGETDNNREDGEP